jgi:3-deoxy-D-manno-octulosonic-acid transferase
MKRPNALARAPTLLLRCWPRRPTWRGCGGAVAREPLYRSAWNERLGCSRRAGARQGVVWLHAVSLGETRAAAP